MNTFTSSQPIPPLFDTFSGKSPATGRFAPSPTGALHFGSLIAATASYLCVHNQKAAANSQWLLRIEDVDTQRIQKGATRAIIKTLEAYGFEWDGEILYQSKRTEIYQNALESIRQHTYPCSCTRKQLQESAATGKFGYIYPGFCRKGLRNPENTHQSMRLRTTDDNICFDDYCQKHRFCQNINKEVGDFILKRSDGLFAYQLAVVVDDAWQGVNQIVRGADLYDNTPRQIYLQKLLAYPQPQYLHFPVGVDHSGKKLSKQNLSPELSLKGKRKQLIKALEFLGQQPLEPQNYSSVEELWQWAKLNWDASKIPRKMKQTVTI